MKSVQIHSAEVPELVTAPTLATPIAVQPDSSSWTYQIAIIAAAVLLVVSAALL